VTGLSNPYLRALIVNAGLFLAVFLRMMQDLGSKWTPRHSLTISLVTVVSFMTTILVGTLARRSATPWSWLKIIFASMGCGLVLLLLLVLVQKTSLLG
jgi:hypothetical protein